jgi:hypothetical protein
MAQGHPPSGSVREAGRERPLSVIPPAALLGGVLLLGLHVPAPLRVLLEHAAHALE